MRHETVVVASFITTGAAGVAVREAAPSLGAAVNASALEVYVTGHITGLLAAHALVRLSVAVGTAAAPTKLLTQGFPKIGPDQSGTNQAIPAALAVNLVLEMPPLNLRVGGINGGLPITSGDTYLWVTDLTFGGGIQTVVTVVYQIP